MHSGECVHPAFLRHTSRTYGRHHRGRHIFTGARESRGEKEESEEGEIVPDCAIKAKQTFTRGRRGEERTLGGKLLRKDSAPRRDGPFGGSQPPKGGKGSDGGTDRSQVSLRVMPRLAPAGSREAVMDAGLLPRCTRTKRQFARFGVSLDTCEQVCLVTP